MKYLRRLWPIFKTYRLQIIISMLLLTLLAAISLAIPTIIQRVIDFGIVAAEVKPLVISALSIFILAILRSGLNFIQRYLMEWIASHIGFDIRNLLYNHIQNLPFSFHDHSQSGQLISRCIEDVRAIERFAGFGIVELLRISLLTLAITVILLIQQPSLAAIAMLPLVPLLMVTWNFGRRVGSFFYSVDQALGNLSARLQENVSGVQVVRAFAREEYETARFKKGNQILYDARLKVMNQWSLIMPTTNFLVAVCTILILWFGGQKVIQGQMTVGEVVAFNAYMVMLAGPVGQLAWLVNSAGEADAGAQRTLEILDTIPAIRTSSKVTRLDSIRGKVEFDHVSFQYGSQNSVALDDIHIEVLPNQVIALIGPTGSGKSTLVNLIPRFYDATQGSVLIDGVDVRNLDLTFLRKQIGIVLQTSLLFSMTIRENIAFGKPDASLEEIIEAAKKAQAHDFIQDMLNGYDTVVGERGVTLSGGQRQRVAIARALILNPRILILDDSTSSVDTETERLIQKALEDLMVGRTTFVIAHRLSTVRRADLILVMDQGKIIEKGTHDALLSKNGLYRDIYNLQLRDQEQFHEEMIALQTENSHTHPQANQESTEDNE